MPVLFAHVFIAVVQLLLRCVGMSSALSAPRSEQRVLAGRCDSFDDGFEPPWIGWRLRSGHLEDRGDGRTLFTI